MTELVMKTEAEVEDFTDELSDEALDRAEGASLLFLTALGPPVPVVPFRRGPLIHTSCFNR
jgi:hypothetical protein